MRIRSIRPLFRLFGNRKVYVRDPPRPGAAASPLALYSRMHDALPVECGVLPLSAGSLFTALEVLCQMS